MMASVRSLAEVRALDAGKLNTAALHIEVDSDGEEITAVRVGGQVVPVLEGVVRF